jgi:enoyl-CoA hydratase/carnithine racemase
MNFVRVEYDQNVAVLTLSRGKVNAINDQLVDELQVAVANATADEPILTL